MSDLATSILRDVTGKVVGMIVGLALAAGVTIPADLSAQMTVAVGGTLTLTAQVAYYVAVRWAEQHWSAAGRLLGAAREPSYGIDLPVHARVVIDHEAVAAEAQRIHQEVQERLQDAAREQRYRRQS